MQHIPDFDEAVRESEREKMMADRMKRADMVFDRLLLSRYHRYLAEDELLEDPEHKQEPELVGEFCYEIEDHLRALLREQRGESPGDLRRRRAAEAARDGQISPDREV